MKNSLIFCSVKSEVDLLLWNVNHLNVWIEALESGFVGGDDVLSEVRAFFRVLVISSLDVGGLGLLESLLLGDNIGSNSLTGEEGWVGFVISKLKVLDWFLGNLLGRFLHLKTNTSLNVSNNHPCECGSSFSIDSTIVVHIEPSPGVCTVFLDI